MSSRQRLPPGALVALLFSAAPAGRSAVLRCRPVLWQPPATGGSWTTAQAVHPQPSCAGTRMLTHPLTAPCNRRIVEDSTELYTCSRTAHDSGGALGLV